MIKRSLLLGIFLCFNLYSQNVFALKNTKYPVSVIKIIDGTISANGPLNFCQGGEVTLSTTKTEGSTYQWLKDNNEITGAITNTYIATTSGAYTLVETQNDKTEIKYNVLTVVVSVKPTPSFTSDAVAGQCSNTAVTFTNTSTNALSYEWDFGDPKSLAANTSTLKNPVHTFIGTPGDGTQSFQVKLTVKNGTCTETTLPTTISTSKIPDANLGGTGYQTYQGLPYFTQCSNSASEFTFFNNSTTETTNKLYKIEWGDGSTDYESTAFTTSIDHSYNVGVYKLKYHVTGINGCVSSIEYNVFVGNTPAGGIISPGNTSTCTSGLITFIISGTENNPVGTTYKITFSDNTEPIIFKNIAPPTVDHIFNINSCGYTTTNGLRNAFSASIEISNPCGTTAGTVGPIYVSDKPAGQITLSPTRSICVGEIVTATNDGTKNSIVSSTGACTVGKSIWKISPATGWTIINGSLGKDNGRTDQALWLAGSDALSIRYDTPGNYEITLVTAGSSSCNFIDEKKRTICVNPRPVANFSLDNMEGCGSLNVKATNLSNTPTCGNNAYQWSVAYSGSAACSPATSSYKLMNNTSLTSAAPEFQFINPGTYTLSLVTRNSDMGCLSQPVYKTIVVKTKPVVTLSVLSPTCENGSISPTATVLNCYSSTAATYLWSFPGATVTSSTAQSPIGIVYPAAGTYTITLAVTNECGTTTKTQSIVVNETPVMVKPQDLTLCNGLSSGQIAFNTTKTNLQTTYSWTNTTASIGLPLSGTGNITNFIANNNTNAIITATIMVTPKLGNCQGSPITFTIKVNPNAPQANAGTDQNICNANFALLAGNSPGISTGKWSIVSTPATGITFENDALPNTKINGLQPGKTYELMWTINGLSPCPGSSDNVKLTVFPETQGGITTGTATFCGGSNSGSILLSGHTGTILHWESSLNGTTWQQISSSAGLSTYQYTAVAVSTQFRAVIQSGNCASAYSTPTTITVNTIPLKPTTTTSYVYCLNETAIALSASGTGLKWYKGSMADANPTATAPVPVTSIAGSTSYFVTQTINGCESLPETITVKINPAIANNSINADQRICMSGIPALLTQSNTVIGGGTGIYVYQWMVSADAGLTWQAVSGATAAFYQPGSLTGDRQYKRLVTSGSCSAESNVIKITVQGTLTNINISADQTICYGSPPAKLIGELPAGGNGTYAYQWEQSTSSSTAGFTAINGAIMADYQPQALNQDTWYRRNVNSGSCSSLSDAVHITISPVPLTTFSIPNQTVCSGKPTTEVTLLSSTAGTTFNWTAAGITGITGIQPAGTGNIPAQTLINTTNAPITVVYRAQASTGGATVCPGLVANYSIVVNPVPTAIPSAIAKTICSNTSTGITITANVTNTTFSWTASSNPNISGAGTGSGSNIAQTLVNTSEVPQTIVYTITPSFTNQSASCPGTPVEVSVTVNPSPKVQFSVQDMSICSGGTSPAVSLSSTTPGVLIHWQIVNNAGITGLTVTNGTNSIPPQTLINNTNNPITLIYKANAATSDVNACPGAAFEYKITINPIPAIANTIFQQQVCSGRNTSIVPLTSNVDNTTFSWTAVASSSDLSGFLPSGSGQNIPVQQITNTGTVKGIVTYTLTPVANGCSGPAKQYVITVNPDPVFTGPANASAICSNSLFNYTPASSTAGVTFSWTRAAIAGISNAAASGSGNEQTGSIAETLLNTTPNAIVVTYYYTLSFNNCSNGQRYPVTVTVNPIPTTTFSIPNQTICSGHATTEVILSSASAGSTFSWTAADVPGITGIQSSGTSTIPAQTLLNTTNAPLTVVYHAIASTAGTSVCEGIQSSYSIVVNPIPKVTASATAKTICSAAGTGISLMANVSNTTYSWTVSNNPNISGAEVGSGSTIAQTLVNTSADPQLLVYTITPSFTNQSTSCPGDPIEVTITVNPAPKVQFSERDISICSGETSPPITLTTATTGAAITWQVSAPEGLDGVTVMNGSTTIPVQTLTNTTNNPIVLVYKASAITGGTNTCPGATFSYQITINPKPTVANSTLQQEICSADATTLVELRSAVANTTYSWTARASSADLTGFIASGNGNIPAQRIMNPGTAKGKVTFTIIPTANGCSGTAVSYEVTVNPKPVFTGIANPTAICSNTVFSYMPASTSTGVTYNWTRVAVNGISNAATSGSGIDQAGAINETLINTTVNPIKVTYTYTLSINNCSSGETYPVTVTVNPSPTALFAPFAQNGCAPFTVDIKNLNSKTFPNTYTVEFGDGSPQQIFTDENAIIHTYENETNNPITYTLKINTKNDCGVAASIDYLIVVQPQNIFSKLVLQGTDRFGCAPFTIDFSNLNQSTGANVFTWDFGDGSPTQQTHAINEPLQHTYRTNGDFTITLTAKNNCSAISSKQTVTVYPLVKASFAIGQLQYCMQQAVDFTNSSDPQDAALWDFGDGTTSTDISPSHLYTSTGLKTITLKATKTYPDGSSCFATNTQTVMIVSNPISSFNSNAAGLNCTPFRLNVTSTPANAANIEWNFGDADAEGNITTGYNASYTYTKAGVYTVTAKAYSLAGCTETTTQIVQVTETPVPAFTAPVSTICGPTGTVVFTNKTTYTGAGAVKYSWYVNDALVSSATDLTYTFNTPATVVLPYVYRIKLVAMNVLGCNESIEKTIQFNPLPNPAFTLNLNKGCVPFRLQLVNNSTYADQFAWYVDDVLVSEEKTPSNIVLHDPDKTYNIKLVANNIYGCDSKAQTKQAVTYPNPKASFTVKELISCNGVLVLDATNTSTGATSYTWDFGDGTEVYTGTTPAHTYGQAGVYSLQLTASNGFCTDVARKNISIAETPKAAFLPDVAIGCNQLTVTFQNLSLFATSYLWNFGDDTFSTQKNPVHKYKFSSTPYNVRLKVTGDFGCTDEVVMLKMISVFPPPTVNINITPGRTIKVPAYSFNFKAEGSEDIISYKWDFGDGKTADKATVDHSYTNVGVYTIKLSVTSRTGCVTTVPDQVRIEGVPGYLYLPNAFEPAHSRPDMKVFTLKGSGMSYYSIRIFNKWGQVIWESSKLDEDGAPAEFWDGTMKGQPAPQGAYYWTATAQFINGTEWKGMAYKGKTASRTGVVHLIR